MTDIFDIQVQVEEVVDYEEQAKAQITSLLSYAKARTITCPEDAIKAVDDLAIIATIRKRLEAMRVERVKPLNDQVKNINEAFRSITNPLDEADRLTDQELKRYRAVEKAKRDEALAIEAEKFALAQREAKLNDGAITVSLAPVAKPEEPPKRIQGDIGSVSVRQLPQFVVEDITKLTAEFLVVNMVALGKQIRAGRRNIPGVHIWMEDSLTVRERKGS